MTLGTQGTGLLQTIGCHVVTKPGRQCLDPQPPQICTRCPCDPQPPTGEGRHVHFRAAKEFAIETLLRSRPWLHRPGACGNKPGERECALRYSGSHSCEVPYALCLTGFSLGLSLSIMSTSGPHMGTFP